MAVVTGGGRGLGREHALELARQGAAVVVNDYGGGIGGEALRESPADSVVAEIEALGGSAVADTGDVSTEEGARGLIERAVTRFGRLDAVVNNAGILLDRMLVNMTVEEWDAVIRVHLRSTFLTMQIAAAYWREQKKAGDDVGGHIVNTSSPAGLYGNLGQLNYVAAKAGIAAMTIAGAAELSRYDVTVNAIAPVALTRMTESMPALRDDVRQRQQAEGGFFRRDPANVAPLVAWLASPESGDVTGRIFQVEGGQIAVVDGNVIGAENTVDERRRTEDVGACVRSLLAKVRPPAGISGYPGGELSL